MGVASSFRDLRAAIEGGRGTSCDSACSLCAARAATPADVALNSRNFRREIMKPPRLDCESVIIGGNRTGVFSERWGMLVPTMESGFQCASCGEWNVTAVDE